jgi:hypothetical protein
MSQLKGFIDGTMLPQGSGYSVTADTTLVTAREDDNVMCPSATFPSAEPLA